MSFGKSRERERLLSSDYITQTDAGLGGRAEKMKVRRGEQTFILKWPTSGENRGSDKEMLRKKGE